MPQQQFSLGGRSVRANRSSTSGAAMGAGVAKSLTPPFTISRAQSVTQSEVNATLALLQAGKFAQALASAQRLAKRSPDLVPLLDLQGAALRKLNKPAQALAFFQRSLEIGVASAITHFNLGAVLFDLCRYGAAAPHLKQALSLAPDNPAMTQALALCLNGMGRFLETVELLGARAQSGQIDCALRNTLGLALYHLNRLEEAEACFAKVQSPPQQLAEAQSNLGNLAKARGNLAQARLLFQKALDMAPELATAHRNLSAVTHYEAGHPHIATMKTLLETGKLTPANQSEVHFALFKAHQDCGDIDAAFHHLTAGNQLKNAMVGDDPAEDEALFALLRRIFAQPAPAATSELPFCPIFIVGLPRSGTTLSEQILCGCDGVVGAGELQYATTAMVQLLKEIQATGADKPSPAQIEALRRDLSAKMLPHAEGAPVVIDKMPLNFRWVGALLSAFPEAKVIHTTRPPADNCWGLYKICFNGNGNGFAYDLQSITAYQNLADDLMQYWTALFPGKIHHLDHSQLTQDPETQARALVDFCALQWSEDCLHPERQTGAVLTASALQVRRPIQHKAVADWTPYQSHLAPLCDLFQA